MGRATSSLLLTMRGSFRVATTVPTMRARIIPGEGGLRVDGSGLADWQRVLEIRVRPRNHVNREELTHPSCRGGAGVGGRFHSSDVAPHYGRDVTGADLFPADQRDLGGLHH